MAFSYSFHISAKSHAVSTIGKIGQVGKHNTRAYETKDYDRNLIEIIVGTNNILEDMKVVYHQEFDEVLSRYNEGKRSDRQITDYLEHVSNSRNDVGVEIILQIGDRDFWEDKSLDERKKMSAIFSDQIDELRRLCPEFKIANVAIHYDEESPHMHVVGVPVSEGFKKGMERQCTKTKVFTKESLSMLQDKMRKHAEKCMEKVPELFEGMTLKEKEKGRNKDIPKSSLDDFYELENEKKEVKKELQKIEKTIHKQKLQIIANDDEIKEQEKTIQGQNNEIINLNNDINELVEKKAAMIESVDEEVKLYKEKRLKEVDEEVNQIRENKIQDVIENVFSEAKKRIYDALSIVPYARLDEQKGRVLEAFKGAIEALDDADREKYTSNPFISIKEAEELRTKYLTEIGTFDKHDKYLHVIGKEQRRYEIASWDMNKSQKKLDEYLSEAVSYKESLEKPHSLAEVVKSLGLTIDLKPISRNRNLSR